MCCLSVFKPWLGGPGNCAARMTAPPRRPVRLCLSALFPVFVYPRWHCTAPLERALSQQARKPLPASSLSESSIQCTKPCAWKETPLFLSVHIFGLSPLTPARHHTPAVSCPPPHFPLRTRPHAPALVSPPPNNNPLPPVRCVLFWHPPVAGAHCAPAFISFHRSQCSRPCPRASLLPLFLHPPAPKPPMHPLLGRRATTVHPPLPLPSPHAAK